MSELLSPYQSIQCPCREHTCPALLESCTKPSARRGQDSWLTVPPRLYLLRKGEFPKAKLKCKATEAVMEDDQVHKSWLFLFFPHFTVSLPQQSTRGAAIYSLVIIYSRSHGSLLLALSVTWHSRLVPGAHGCMWWAMRPLQTYMGQCGTGGRTDDCC